MSPSWNLAPSRAACLYSLTCRPHRVSLRWAMAIVQAGCDQLTVFGMVTMCTACLLHAAWAALNGVQSTTDRSQPRLQPRWQICRLQARKPEGA